LIDPKPELKHRTNVNAIAAHLNKNGDVLLFRDDGILTFLLFLFFIQLLPSHIEHSWRVLDVTIAMAYAMLSSYGKRHRSISAAAALLRGYYSVYPLLDIEREHIVLLIVCRLACSVTLGAYSLQQNPENKYLLLHSEPAWKALELLWGYDDCSYRKQMTDTLIGIFHKACFYTTTSSNDGTYDEIPCYDLAFPDPDVVDPFANIRVDGNKNTSNQVAIK
jgi:hypothetical protein